MSQMPCIECVLLAGCKQKITVPCDILFKWKLKEKVPFREISEVLPKMTTITNSNRLKSVSGIKGNPDILKDVAEAIEWIRKMKEVT